MAYSATNTYATRADVKLRLTRYGLLRSEDVDDQDNESSAAEIEYTNDAIEWANTWIDAAICEMIASISSRPSNEWLRNRCVDIAAYRVASLGGRKAPDQLLSDYQIAMEHLELVRQGSLKVPGLVIDSPTVDGRNAGLPIAVNAGGREWRHG